MTDVSVIAGPAIKDFFPYHGDTFKFSMVFSSDQTLDLTGHTPLFQLRNSAGTLVKDWSSYVTIASATRIDVVVTPAGWVDVPRPRGAQPFDYDLQFTAPVSGTVRTPLRGKMVVTGDISHG